MRFITGAFLLLFLLFASSIMVYAHEKNEEVLEINAHEEISDPEMDKSKENKAEKESRPDHIQKQMQKHWDDSIKANKISIEDWIIYDMQDLDKFIEAPPTHFKKSKEEDKESKHELKYDDTGLSDTQKPQVNDVREHQHDEAQKQQDVNAPEDVGNEVLGAISSELEKLQKEGDSLPLFLIHKNEKKVKVLFQRDYGNGAKVALQFDYVDDKWQLTEDAEIPSYQ